MYSYVGNHLSVMWLQLTRNIDPYRHAYKLSVVLLVFCSRVVLLSQIAIGAQFPKWRTGSWRIHGGVWARPMEWKFLGKEKTLQSCFSPFGKENHYNYSSCEKKFVCESDSCITTFCHGCSLTTPLTDFHTTTLTAISAIVLLLVQLLLYYSYSLL